MHILLLHQAFAEIGEAGATRHHEMALQMGRKGDRVTIIAGTASYLTGREAGSMGRRATTENVRILRPQAYASWHRSFFHRVLSFFSFMIASFAKGVRVQGVDVVWGTSPPLFQAVSAWLLSRLKRAPFLFEVRDLWPLFAIEVGVLRSKVLIALSKWLEAFLYRRADLIVINSPGFAGHVLERGARRVELVANGVDSTMFDPADEGKDFREQHGLGNAFVVVYAGAHGISNDLGVVIQAASLLKDEEVIFLLIGDGKEKPNLVRRSASLGLENLRFLSPLPKLKMGKALAAADACLAILKPIEAYKTTYPNKVFDYMAAARPVLLAIDGVIRQVVEGAEAGVFVAPGSPQALAQAVLELKGDPAAAQRMGERGRQCVEAEFDRALQAQRLQGLFSELVKGKGA